MIKYFISYYATVNKSVGFGNCFLERYNPIQSQDDILSISKEIAKFNKVEAGEIIIINFQEIK